MLGPTPTHQAPPTSIILYWIGRFWFAITGWKVEGKAPDGVRAVLIAAPHTSNWDFVWFLGASFIFRVRLHFVAKDTLFWFPLGVFLRAMGGIPVDRRAPGGLVGQLAAEFAKREHLIVTVPAAGTRHYTDCWRSGFYYIAREAGVPVAPGFLDFKTRTAGIGPVIELTGDLKADMDVFRAFYGPITAKYPELKSAVRLKGELPGENEG